MTSQPQFFAFVDYNLLAEGDVIEVVKAARLALVDQPKRIAIYDASNGRPVDFDLRGSEEDVIARLADHPALPAEAKIAAESGGEGRGRGRPKLGVVSREISLLPRHWAWLGQQRGGASATLRRLVDEARKAAAQDPKAVIEATYSFMSDLMGDAPHFEAASRALFAKDMTAFDAAIALWPEDVQGRLRQATAPMRGSA